MDCQPWFYLCLALCATLLAALAMFFNYSLQLDKKSIRLEKEIKEVERVNGKEKADIKELQARVKELEAKGGKT